MNAKEYLEQIGKLEHQIECMKYRLDEYETLAYSIKGQNYDKEPIDGTRKNNAPYEKFINLKCDLEKKLAAKEEELKQIKSNALMMIEKLDNEDYKKIIIERYFNKKMWDDIIIEMYVSRSTVKRWHEEALEKLDLNGPQ